MADLEAARALAQRLNPTGGLNRFGFFLLLVNFPLCMRTGSRSGAPSASQESEELTPLLQGYEKA
jgi:hypothetical protein